MRTPAGKECGYFYGDYYRGRQHEECRLLAAGNPSLPWTPDLCATCPVPDILLANACPNLVLEPQLSRPFPFIRKRVEVVVNCTQSNSRGFDPHVGCGECHKLPEIFTQ